MRTFEWARRIAQAARGTSPPETGSKSDRDVDRLAGELPEGIQEQRRRILRRRLRLPAFLVALGIATGLTAAILLRMYRRDIESWFHGIDTHDFDPLRHGCGASAAHPSDYLAGI